MFHRVRYYKRKDTMPERLLLFWSARVKPLLGGDLLKADRAIEVPDMMDASLIQQAAQRLTAVVREELGHAHSEGKTLRVVQVGPPALQGVLEHVIDSILSPVNGELVVLKRRRRTENAPSVLLDSDAAERVFGGFKDTDFKGPPSPDRRLYEDDLPATLTPPKGN